MKVIPLLLVLISGCSSWPATCKTDFWGGAVACRCTRMRFLATPATPQATMPSDVTVVNEYNIIPDCDGIALPITIHANNLKGCTVN